MTPGEVEVQLDNDVLMDVLKGLTSGLSYAELVKQLETGNVKVPHAEIPAYVLEANRYFANMSKFAKEVEIGKSIERLNALYSSSLKELDFKSCLLVQKEMNALLGLKLAAPNTSLDGKFTIVLPAKKKPAKSRKRAKAKR